MAIGLLETTRIRLEPMSMAHHAALCDIGLDPALWERTTIRVRTAEDMATYMRTALDAQAAGTALPFVIALQNDGTIVGTTRIHSIVPAHHRCEIGFTWVGVLWQRTGISTASKHLLLTHAFEHLDCQRVEFKADASNEASRRALEHLGAVHEGVLRSYMYSEHRGPRDVALFSVVRAEWPAMKNRLRHA